MGLSRETIAQGVLGRRCQKLSSWEEKKDSEKTLATHMHTHTFAMLRVILCEYECVSLREKERGRNIEKDF
jgi:hypothetical protein